MKKLLIAAAAFAFASAAHAAEKQPTPVTDWNKIDTRVLMIDFQNTSNLIIHTGKIKKWYGCFDNSGKDYNFMCAIADKDGNNMKPLVTVMRDTSAVIEPITVGVDGWCADTDTDALAKTSDLENYELSTTCTSGNQTVTVTTKLTNVKFMN